MANLALLAENALQLSPLTDKYSIDYKSNFV